MELQEILQALEGYGTDQPFPAEALKTAADYQEEITPYLLKALDDVLEHGEDYVTGKNGTNELYVCAMYLLAQFREEKAFPQLLRLLTLDEELLDELIGDILTEDFGILLSSTYDGNFEQLDQIVKDNTIGDFVRATVLDAMFFLVLQGRIEKKEFLEYLQDFMENHLKDNITLAACLSNLIASHHVSEAVPGLRKLYDNGKVDLFLCGSYSHFLDSLYDYSDGCQKVVYKTGYLEDAEQAMGKWAREEEPILEKSIEEVRKEFEESLSSLLLMPAHKPEKQYPSLVDENPDHLCIVRDYSPEDLQLDILLYEALENGTDSLYEETPHDMENRYDWLKQAYQTFHEMCAKEEIKTFQQFDEKHRVHFRAEEWMAALVDFLEKLPWKGRHVECFIEDVKNTMEQFKG